MEDYQISMSESFIDRIKMVIEGEENSDEIFGLRAGLIGGGCSGMQYDFSFATEQEEGDIVIERDDLKMVIDPISIEYMRGSEFDYTKSISGEQIVVKNPNVQRSCGCGSSVQV